MTKKLLDFYIFMDYNKNISKGVIWLKNAKTFYGNHTIISKQKSCNTVYKSDRVSMDIMYMISSQYDKRNEYSKKADAMHLHSMHELHIVKKGEVVYELENDKKIMVGKNSFVIIPPSLKHKIVHESYDFKKTMMRFEIISAEEDRDSFYNTALRLMKIPVLYECSPKMTELLNVMEEISNSDIHDKYNIIFNLCVSYIIEICNVVVRTKHIRKNDVVADKRVQSAIEFIKNNISSSITATDVAKSVYISPHHLSLLFKENIGMTPAKYIRMAKNEYICKLLIETDLGLSDIAEMVGMSDSTSLIKRFKRTEGNTPKKYRQSITK